VAAIDAYQGEETSVAILTIATDKAMGFIKDPAHLLVAIARGQNSLIIITNWTDLKNSSKRAMKRLAFIRNVFELDKTHQIVDAEPGISLFKDTAGGVNEEFTDSLCFDTRANEGKAKKDHPTKNTDG
jgi:hypothetical protein